MSIELALYLAGMSDNFLALTMILFSLTFVFFMLCILPVLIQDIGDVNLPKLKKLCLSLLFIALIATVVPSSKTIYMMLGVSESKHFVNSETGDKVIKILNKKLDEMMDVKNK